MASEGTEKLGPPWTVLKLLDWSRGYFAEHGIDSPRLDAELLLSHVLGIDRVRLYMEFDRPLVADELAAYRALVRRRAAREPVAYLTGTRGFWSLDLHTDPRALVPRPETEVLVEEVLARLPEDAAGTVVDVGTGTGAIAIAIASERPTVTVIATDVSPDALALAAENVEANDLGSRIELLEGDLLEPVGPDVAIDYIVSNPPYVADSALEELDPEVAQFEPHTALFAGPKGLDVIERLVPAAFARLQPGGWLSLEIGYDQGDAVQELLTDAGFEDVALREDYGGQPRVVSGRRS